jgi:predicted acyl esterase
VHGGSHWAGFYSQYGQDLQRRFFDAFLKGADTWTDQPRVALNVRHADGSFTPRGEDEWPLARTTWTQLYLDAVDTTLEPDVPLDPASSSYEAMGEGVTFLAAPLTEQTEITGPVQARLWVSSTTADADLFLVLRAFDEAGREVLFDGANDPKAPLSQGWLRVSHRALDPERTRPWLPFHSHREREAVVPGAVYEVDVELWATCVVLPAGYRLALSVLGRDFDHGQESRLHRGSGPFLHHHPEDRPAAVFANTVTVHTGPATPSSLTLPVIPALDPDGASQ